MSFERPRGTVLSKYVDRVFSDRPGLGGVILLAPAVFLFFVLAVFPISYGIWASFQAGFAGELTYTGANNYLSLMERGRFWNSIWRGVVYALYSVGLQTVVGVGVALLLNRQFKFNNVVRTIVLVPYLVPTVATVLIFEWMLNSQTGLINFLLIQAGVIEDGINFLTEAFAMHTVVWVSSWKFSIFVVLLVLARLQSIDRTQYELAKVNGANAIRRFFDVTYPNIRSVVFLVVLLRGIWMFNKFDIIFLLTSGGPFDATTTMVIYAYNIAFNQFQFGLGSAVTTIIFLILLVNSTVYFYFFKPEEEVDV